MHLQKRIYHCFLLLTALVAYLPITAQDTSYVANIQYFTTTDGLSHRAVKSIFQDREGVIWIGTENGLNRFDGYSFKHYLGKTHGVDLRSILRIGQDDEGWLWLKGEQQIVFFHPKKEIFKTLEERFGVDCLLIKDFSIYIHFGCFFNDNAGRLYLERSGTNELYSYHSSEGFKKIISPLIFDRVNLHEITGNNELIFSETVKGNLVQKKYTKCIIKNDKLVKINSQDYFDHETIFSSNKLYKTNHNWKIDNQGTCQVFNSNEELLISLDDLNISNWQSTFFDKKNRAWISTGFGFYIIEIQESNFKFVSTPVISGFEGKSARGITADTGNMVVIFEPQGSAIYNFQKKNWSTQKGAIWNRAIYKEGNNDFWIGSLNLLTHWKDENQKDYVIEKIVNNIIFSVDIWNILPSLTSKDKLWLGSKIGLISFDVISGEYKFIENNVLGNSRYTIQTIVRDKRQDNWLWLCTDKGLMLFDETKNTFIGIYDFEQSEEYFLPSISFQHFYQDDDGTYWLATSGEGIIHWDKENNTYRQFTIKDDLSNDVIYSIYPDDFGNLWVSSDYGIMKMNKTTFSVESFLYKDGIGQTEFNRISHFQYRDKNNHQQIYFGGLNGVTTFYPKDFQQTDNQQPKPFLTLLNFQQFNNQKQSVIDKTLTLNESNSIVLQPNDYIFQLEIGLLNYDDVDNNQYTYQTKINGKTSNWTTQKNRSIQLGLLPYGQHQLTIKAKTISNIEAANQLTYTIIVRRPFYLTWWFSLLSITSLATLGIYWYKRRTTTYKRRQIELEKIVEERTFKIQKQAEELQQLDTLKSRFFANVSHELRTPLTLILGPINATLKRKNLENYDFTMLSKAQQSGKKLLKLVGSILDLSKMESGKMELQEEVVLLFPFIRRIVSAFESHAQREGIQFQFNYKTEDDLQITIDKNKLEIILNNLLSNAMKFTPKGELVVVEVKDIKNKIEIAVADTGRGIHPDDLPNIFNRFYQSTQKNAPTEGGTGIGLALSREFVQLMNGEIWVESELGTGSQFYISLPRKEVLGMIEQPTLQEKQVVRQPTELPKNTAPSSHKNILIVEDNYSLREYLETILSEHFNIQTASNGQITLDILNNNSKENQPLPDLIVSDIMMPVMDGYQLLTILKSTPQFKSIPVIMLTARADIQDKLKALRIGVDDYLLKPFDEEELLTRIENLLANYEERKAFVQLEETTKQGNPTTITISDDDQKWLEDLENLILEYMNSSNFSNDYLAELLFISRKTLYRNIKRMTGLTPSKYIRTIRLQRAKELLEQGHSVKETAYKVGFQKSEYFSSLFKKEFGKTPSEYFIF